MSRRPLSSTGNGVGMGVRTCRWEGIGLLREIALAMALAEPGIWRAEMAILKWAVKKNKHRRRQFTGGYMARPELMADTTAILSQWTGYCYTLPENPPESHSCYYWD